MAIITTAALISPLLEPLGLAGEYAKALVVLAIGAGAMTVSHLSDSYFWVVSDFRTWIRPPPWMPYAGNPGARPGGIGTIFLLKSVAGWLENEGNASNGTLSINPATNPDMAGGAEKVGSAQATCFQVGGVPLEFLAHAKSHVAQVVGLGEQYGIAKRTGGGRAATAGHATTRPADRVNRERTVLAADSP